MRSINYYNVDRNVATDYLNLHFQGIRSRTFLSSRPKLLKYGKLEWRALTSTFHGGHFFSSLYFSFRNKVDISLGI